MEDENLEKEKERKDRETRIKKEQRRLAGIFAKIDICNKKAVQSLIENAAFMAVTLQDLQVKMNSNGVVSTYKNGENQYGTKKSPEVEIYNTMVKNHAGIIKQLTDLIPKPENKLPPNDGFEEFVNNR